MKNLELSKEIPIIYGLEKGDYKEREHGNVKAIISSLVFYKWYYNNNLSILDMAADIMYKIACSNHPFTNGNKRTALLSCGAFLYSIGLYLFFYKFNSKADYLSKWEDFFNFQKKSWWNKKSHQPDLKFDFILILVFIFYKLKYNASDFA